MPVYLGFMRNNRNYLDIREIYKMKLYTTIFFKAIKDAFIVYDNFKNNGERVSQEMVFNAIMLISAVLVGFNVISTGFEEQEAMAIGTGIYAMLNMFNRVRSPGGEVKLRVEVKSKLQKNSRSSDNDDHFNIL